jgi:hypothetical protein
LLLAALGPACSTGSSKPVVETAFDEKGRRDEFFESTLRVLDEHPEYVDEFFAHALRHEKTLDRFFADSAAALKEDRLARMVARHLVNNPESLRMVLIATLDAASDKPEAQRATAEAIEQRAQVSAMAIASRPATVRASFRALLAEVLKRPDAREAFLDAMRENRATLVQVFLENPDLAKAFAGSAVKQGAREITQPD